MNHRQTIDGLSTDLQRTISVQRAFPLNTETSFVLEFGFSGTLTFPAIPLPSIHFPPPRPAPTSHLHSKPAVRRYVSCRGFCEFHPPFRSPLPPPPRQREASGKSLTSPSGHGRIVRRLFDTGGADALWEGDGVARLGSAAAGRFRGPPPSPPPSTAELDT